MEDRVEDHMWLGSGGIGCWNPENAHLQLTSYWQLLPPSIVMHVKRQAWPHSQPHIPGNAPASCCRNASHPSRRPSSVTCTLSAPSRMLPTRWAWGGLPLSTMLRKMIRHLRRLIFLDLVPMSMGGLGWRTCPSACCMEQAIVAVVAPQ